MFKSSEIRYPLSDRAKEAVEREFKALSFHLQYSDAGHLAACITASLIGDRAWNKPSSSNAWSAVFTYLYFNGKFSSSWK